MVVRKKDLKIIASFICEHHRGSDDKGTCFDHAEQGGCCNSCWARKWAEEQLGKQMKRDPIEILKNLTECLGDSGDQDIEEVKEELREQGIDPDRAIKGVKTLIKANFKIQRMESSK